MGTMGPTWISPTFQLACGAQMCEQAEKNQGTMRQFSFLTNLKKQITQSQYGNVLESNDCQHTPPVLKSLSQSDHFHR
jgi:hypothetical protein